MNDFIKEELEYLEEFISDAKRFFDDSDRVLFNLHNKVKSMIDNYKCNHESDGLIYTSFPPQNKCKKCKEFYR